MAKEFIIKIIYISGLLIYPFWNCNPSIKTNNNIEEPPPFHKEDKKYANIFKSLDGTWKGEFIILEDTNRVNINEVELEKLRLEQIKSPQLKRINKIKVKQVYASESPYFQRVIITDYYPETGREEVSNGVNKIEKGKISCIVNKPNETVIHQGKVQGDHTIIWYRNEQRPQRIEYFQETVDEQFYEIIGYGYYEGDNLNLSPKLWFYGKYEKQ